MSDKREKPFDVRATNPRYGGAMMSDVVRALFRPLDPKVRERIAAREARRSVTPEKVEDGESGVKAGV